MDEVWIGLVVIWARAHSPAVLGVLGLFACGLHLAAHDRRKLVEAILVVAGGACLQIELQQPIATTALAYGLVLAHFARAGDRRAWLLAAATALASQAWHVGLSAETAAAHLALALGWLLASLAAGKLADPGRTGPPLRRTPH